MQSHDNIVQSLNQIRSENLDISQKAIFPKISAFIDMYLIHKNNYSKQTLNKIQQQLTQGYCSGESTLKAYAWQLDEEAIRYDDEKNTKPRDDSQWFYSILYILAKWDPQNESLSEADQHQIERFVSLIEYYQNIPEYQPSAQGSLEASLSDTLGRTAIADNSIGSSFSQEQLEQLLNAGIIPEGTITLGHTYNHVITIFKTNTMYKVFDPRSENGEALCSSSKELAQWIFNVMENIELTKYQHKKNTNTESFTFDRSKPWPIGFKNFHLSDKNISALSSSKIEELLNTLQPSIEAPHDYADNISPLISAVKMNSLESVKYHLSHPQLNIDDITSNGQTALFYAVDKGYLNIVRLLLQHRASTAIKDVNDNTPLFGAIANNHHEVVKLLLDHKVDIEAKNKFETTPLMWAASRGNLPAVILLIDNAAQVNNKKFDGTTALMLAAQNGHLDTVEYLLNHGAKLDMHTNRGRDALTYATDNGHLEVIIKLIEKGADPESEIPHGQIRTILEWASRRRQTKLVQLLVEKLEERIAKQQTLSTYTITWLINNERIDLLKQITHDPSISQKIGDILMTSVLYEDSYQLKQFLKEVDPNIVASNKKTLLIAAIQTGKIEIVKTLIDDPRTDLNQTKEGGNTPLTIALQKENADIIQALIKDSRTVIDPKLMDKAIEIFSKTGKLPLVKIINEALEVRRHNTNKTLPSSRQNEAADKLQFFTTSNHPTNPPPLPNFNPRSPRIKK